MRQSQENLTGAYSKHIVITLNILLVKFLITITLKKYFFALIFKERNNKLQNESIMRDYKISRGNFLCIVATEKKDKISH